MDYKFIFYIIILENASKMIIIMFEPEPKSLPNPTNKIKSILKKDIRHLKYMTINITAKEKRNNSNMKCGNLTENKHKFKY